MSKKIVEVVDEKRNVLNNITRRKARNLVKKFKARYLKEDSIILFPTISKKMA